MQCIFDTRSDLANFKRFTCYVLGRLTAGLLCEDLQEASGLLQVSHSLCESVHHNLHITIFLWLPKTIEHTYLQGHKTQLGFLCSPAWARIPSWGKNAIVENASYHSPKLDSGILGSKRLGVIPVVSGVTALGLTGLACSRCLNRFLFRQGDLLEVFRHLIEGLDFWSKGISLLPSKVRLLEPSTHISRQM